VERREARRPASLAGDPWRSGDRLDRKAGHRVRRSAPAPVGAPPPLVVGGAPENGGGFPANPDAPSAAETTGVAAMPRTTTTFRAHQPAHPCARTWNRDCVMQPRVPGAAQHVSHGKAAPYSAAPAVQLCHNCKVECRSRFGEAMCWWGTGPSPIVGGSGAVVSGRGKVDRCVGRSVGHWICSLRMVHAGR
jgi:hypothetical protein